MKLNVAAVYANPDQPRKIFEPEALRELGASIRQNGLLQPITVVARKRGKTGRYMIVAGERRYRATVAAGLKTIAANVIKANDEQVAVGAIVENLQRADISQLEEARAFKRMLDAGHTPESLADRLGVKLWRVVNRVKLLDLSPEHLDLFAKGVLEPKQALELARLPAELRPALFAVIKSGQADNFAKLRAFADGIAAAAAQEKLFDLPAPPTKEEVAVLTRFERLIFRLTSACNEGIKDNEVVALRKVDPDRASVVIQQLGLIRKDIERMEKALLHSAAQGALAA